VFRFVATTAGNYTPYVCAYDSAGARTCSSGALELKKPAVLDPEIVKDMVGKVDLVRLENSGEPNNVIQVRDLRHLAPPCCIHCSYRLMLPPHAAWEAWLWILKITAWHAMNGGNCYLPPASLLCMFHDQIVWHSVIIDLIMLSSALQGIGEITAGLEAAKSTNLTTSSNTTVNGTDTGNSTITDTGFNSTAIADAATDVGDSDDLQTVSYQPALLLVAWNHGWHISYTGPSLHEHEYGNLHLVCCPNMQALNNAANNGADPSAVINAGDALNNATDTTEEQKKKICKASRQHATQSTTC
jgi:hypothetical protein